MSETLRASMPGGKRPKRKDMAERKGKGRGKGEGGEEAPSLAPPPPSSPPRPRTRTLRYSEWRGNSAGRPVDISWRSRGRPICLPSSTSPPPSLSLLPSPHSNATAYISSSSSAAACPRRRDDGDRHTRPPGAAAEGVGARGLGPVHSNGSSLSAGVRAATLTRKRNGRSRSAVSASGTRGKPVVNKNNEGKEMKANGFVNFMPKLSSL